MDSWWSKLSLKSKLQLPIQLLVVLVIVQRVALEQFEQHIREESKQKMLVSADGVLNGLNMLRINGITSHENRRALHIKKMRASEKVAAMASQSNEVIKRTAEAVKSKEQLSEELDSTVGWFKV